MLALLPRPSLAASIGTALAGGMLCGAMGAAALLVGVRIGRG